MRVEWPGKEEANPPPRGYLYIAFEDETRVKASIIIFLNLEFAREGILCID